MLIWLVILAAAGISGRIWGGEEVDNFEIPGAEAQKAFDLLESRFPQQAGDSATVVFFSERGVQDPSVRPLIQTALEDMGRLPPVVAVTSPFAAAGAISQDGRIAFGTVQFNARANEVEEKSVDQLIAIGEETAGPDLQVEMTGPVILAHEFGGLGYTEAVALTAATVVLLVSFGSVIAMGLPLVVALFALGSGLSLLSLFALVVDISRFAPQMALMIGLAVAIDYALLIVTRHRQGLARGLAVDDSIAEAISTAGRTVLFAGVTVAFAVLGLYLIGIPTIATVGMTTSIVLVLTVLAAITLLPALLGFAGQSIDRFHIPKLLSREVRSESTLWFRLSGTIQRRAWPFAIGSLAILLLLASPVLALRLGSSDAGNNPTSFTSRRAYDLLTQGFGPGFNGPLLIAVDLSGDADGQAMERLRDALANAPGVAAIGEPRFNGAGDTAVITVTPASSPQSTETESLVHRLRDDVIPAALTGSEAKAFVGGETAAHIDIGQKISQRLPLFMGAVIGLSMILLLVMFRSILIPLKAAVMNLLSIGAAFGVIVAVFQWGWGADLIGVKTGPVESFIPMMMFAILFGLSMDYEMFLLSRIREEYLRTQDNAVAVSMGLATTARVITSAAAVMVAVFLSFMLGDFRAIKMAGLGLATAIFLDATLIRLVMVPAVMNVLGDANWWLPRRLDRLIARLAFERQEATPQEAAVRGD